MSVAYESSTAPKMEKSAIMKAFNKHFFDFIDDIITIFPENVEVIAARDSIELLKRANPHVIVKAWYSFVFSKYSEYFYRGDLEYFLNKDYKDDLVDVQNSNKVLEVIGVIRDHLKNMGDVNREKTLKYLINLCKLCAIYHEQ